MEATRGIKDKGRIGHRPELRRMGPNKRCWINKTKHIFDY